MSVFRDQRDFMIACGQKVTIDWSQTILYHDLIVEEVAETRMAFQQVMQAVEAGVLSNKHIAEVVDGIIDTIYVCCGMLHSLEIDAQAAWDEVHSSNMSKVVDGKVMRREDGKILKPEGYRPPNLLKVIDESWGK